MSLKRVFAGYVYKKGTRSFVSENGKKHTLIIEFRISVATLIIGFQLLVGPTLPVRCAASLSLTHWCNHTRTMFCLSRTDDAPMLRFSRCILTYNLNKFSSVHKLQYIDVKTLFLHVISHTSFTTHSLSSHVSTVEI